MIRHLVLIKPLNQQSVAAVDNILKDKIIGLEKKVKGIKHTEIGADFSDRSQGYKYLFIIDFYNETALLDWKDNEFHIPIKNTLQSHSEMLVFDYQIEEIS